MLFVFRVEFVAIVLVIQMSQEFKATTNKPVRDCLSLWIKALYATKVHLYSASLDRSRGLRKGAAADAGKLSNTVE